MTKKELRHKEDKNNPLIKNMNLSLGIKNLLTKANLKTASDAILSQKQLEAIGLNNNQIKELVDMYKLLRESLKQTIVTNYLIVAGPEDEVKAILIPLTRLVKDIHRITFFNITKDNIDNSQGTYLYDETYTRHTESILLSHKEIGLKMPTMLCQFTTKYELTGDNIINLQPADNNLQIAHYWHQKDIPLFLNEDPNPLLESYTEAGYLMSFEGTIIENEKRKHISDYFINFINDNKIDTFCECPKCGENMSCSRYYVYRECPDCRDNIKAKLMASFNEHMTGGGGA